MSADTEESPEKRLSRIPDEPYKASVRLAALVTKGEIPKKPVIEDSVSRHPSRGRAVDSARKAAEDAKLRARIAEIASEEADIELAEVRRSKAALVIELSQFDPDEPLPTEPTDISVTIP